MATSSSRQRTGRQREDNGKTTGRQRVHGVDHPVPVRITVTYEDTVDVDLHLLVQGEDALEATCLARGDSSIDVTIPPGTNHLVVDTPALGGEERAGAYRLTIERLP